MKVTINGYQIECTPEEFLELTRELKKEGIAEPQILPDDYKPLPDDYRKWISPKPWTEVASYGCQVPGPFTYGNGECTYEKIEPAEYTGRTSITESMFKDNTETNKPPRARADKKEYYERKKALREAERPKDFPPYLDFPKNN